MGWVGDRIDAVARRLAETAADLPLQRAVSVHAGDLRDLVALGVRLGRITEAMAAVGVVGPRTGRAIPGETLGRMLSAAPDAPPAIQPPPVDAKASASPPVARTTAPPPAVTQAPPIAPVSRAGRGLESLAVRRPRT